MIRYYQEKDTGDYLCIDTDSLEYRQGEYYYEGRGTAIENNIMSVCTTSIHRKYLRKMCKRVAKKDVPEDWIYQMIRD